MKLAFIKEIQENIQEKSDNANALVAIYEKNNNISVSLLGNHEKVAQALYIAIYDKSQPELAKQIYEMVKAIVYNIICNNSPIKDDFVAMLRDEFGVISENSCPTIPLIIKGEA